MELNPGAWHHFRGLEAATLTVAERAEAQEHGARMADIIPQPMLMHMYRGCESRLQGWPPPYAGEPSAEMRALIITIHALGHAMWCQDAGRAKLSQ